MEIKFQEKSIKSGYKNNLLFLEDLVNDFYNLERRSLYGKNFQKAIKKMNCEIEKIKKEAQEIGLKLM